MQLKGNFVQVQKLRELSEFGWDDATKCVTASDEVWDAYLVVC